MNIIYKVARAGLETMAAVSEGVARLVTPARQLSVAPSHGLYGTRHWAHFNAYSAAPGWLFVEMGSWTIEANWRTRTEMPRVKLTA
jgi:hypothetical protein